MLTQICQYLRNWFERDKIFDTFTVVDGVLSADTVSLSDYLQDRQYYRIIGSVFNDGVHKYGAISSGTDNNLDNGEDADGDRNTTDDNRNRDRLIDERPFSGAVWSMAIPPDVVSLADEIAAWIAANQTAINSPYVAESFGGYSYSLRTGSGATGDSGGVTWQSQFATRLAPWRKI